MKDYSKLSILRTFGKSSITPVRHVRIQNNKWYQVTMQNVERDPGDGVYLGQGEYTELLPGSKARERRDAHLNHCNRIVEYSGPVYELMTNQYGGEVRHVGYFPSIKALEEKLDAMKAKHDKWIDDCNHEAELHETTAQALEQGQAKQKIGGFDAAYHRSTAVECRKVAKLHEDGFRCDMRTVA